MEKARQHPPVILLLGTRKGNKVDLWLERSRYSTAEVADAFQALEQISDFTVRDTPDVIFLHVDSIAKEREFLQTIVATDSNEPDVPIIGFSDDDMFGEDKILALANRLGQLIPKQNAML